jgi:hypothetical protein
MIGGGTLPEAEIDTLVGPFKSGFAKLALTFSEGPEC